MAKKKSKAANDPTAISRVKAHRQRMTSAGWKQVAVWLPPEAIATLDQLCQDSDSTRQDVVAQLLIERQATTPQPATVTPKTVTSNDPPAEPNIITPEAVKAPAKKTASKKRKAKPAPPATTDAIGLSRPDTFKDSPSAVSVSAEIRDLSKISKGKQWHDWRTLPRKFMASWEAQKHIEAFRQEHNEATIERRHMDDGPTMIEIIATYSDDRPDHRVVYQARR